MDRILESCVAQVRVRVRSPLFTGKVDKRKEEKLLLAKKRGRRRELTAGGNRVVDWGVAAGHSEGSQITTEPVVTLLPRALLTTAAFSPLSRKDLATDRLELGQVLKALQDALGIGSTD